MFNSVKKILFIGNSATYVHEIPQMLCRLAGEAGYPLEVASVTKGGAFLSNHADPATTLGQNALSEISKGYDIVFLQENGQCISAESKRAETVSACRTLHKAIKSSGAKTYFYVRPPYGYPIAEYDSYAQCLEFDKLFGAIASELGVTNAYVNRAFAYAIKNLSVPLWGPDNAHTSNEGAYLAACVFFCTLFHTSSSVLDSDGLPDDTAKVLQQVADRIVLEKLIP